MLLEDVIGLPVVPDVEFLLYANLISIQFVCDDIWPHIDITRCQKQTRSFLLFFVTCRMHAGFGVLEIIDVDNVL